MPTSLSLPSKNETKISEIFNCPNKEKHGTYGGKEESKKGVTKKVNLWTRL